MFAKIFVLLATFISPEGQIATVQPGQFVNVAECQAAAAVLKDRAVKGGIPGDKVFFLCVQTPWNVPGQRSV